MLFSKKHINSEKQKYETFFYTYYERAFHFVVNRVKDTDNAEDITQNVFVHLWNYRKQLKGAQVEAIIFNTCKQEISKFFRVNETLTIQQDFLPNDECDDSEEELLSKLISEQRIEAITESIDLLPPLRRKIFVLNKFEGVTQQQIALELNLPHHTIKYHVSEAMIFLKAYHKNS